MWNDTAYHLVASLLEAFMWDGELVGEENLQEGPGVIVANHMGSIGPVGICCSMPMRLYPWVLGATVDKIQGPETVRKDFVEKVFKIEPPLSLEVARWICRISSPLLLNLGCLPVYATHEAQQETFQSSIRLLMQGKFLLIVPENPEADADPQTGIKPFKQGFLRLGELYGQETGARLPFYPVVVHEAGLVIVGKPFAYNPLNEARAERMRMINLLEGTIKTMHVEVTRGLEVQPVFFRRNFS